jgi:hypothetical protein
MRPRGFESARRWPPASSSTVTCSRSLATRRWKSIGKNRSSRPAITWIGTSGHASNRQGSPNTTSASERWCVSPCLIILGGMSCRKYVTRSKFVLKPSRRAAAVRAAVDPVLSHHSPAVSPGTGIIALTNTKMRTRTRVHTSGAVKPPSDCTTSTKNERTEFLDQLEGSRWWYLSLHVGEIAHRSLPALRDSLSQVAAGRAAGGMDGSGCRVRLR